MRRTFLFLLLLSTPVFAQSTDPWRASVLRVPHGYGAAMAYAPSAAWDIEAAVSERSYDQPVSTFGIGGVAVTEFRHYATHPVDLYLTRHFAARGRVTPFLHAGARYVELAGQRPETIYVKFWVTIAGMPDVPPDTLGWIITLGVAVAFIALVALIAWWMRK